MYRSLYEDVLYGNNKQTAVLILSRTLGLVNVIRGLYVHS